MAIITIARLITTAAGAVALGAVDAITQATQRPAPLRPALAPVLISRPGAPVRRAPW